MPFSDQFLNQAFNGGGDPILTLLRVTFEDQTLYLVNNNENVDSTASGTLQTYLRSRFSLSLPNDTEEGLPQATIDFEVGDIQIIRALRETPSPLTIDIWLVLGSDANFVEFGPVNYQSVGFTVSGTSVSLELEVEPVLHVQVPRHRFTPNIFPGLFEGSQ